eukprot:6324803-Prymnesium_polylepis.1
MPASSSLLRSVNTTSDTPGDGSKGAEIAVFVSLSLMARAACANVSCMLPHSSTVAISGGIVVLDALVSPYERGGGL